LGNFDFARVELGVADFEEVDFLRVWRVVGVVDQTVALEVFESERGHWSLDSDSEELFACAGCDLAEGDVVPEIVADGAARVD
jgi:hypothetical protein